MLLADILTDAARRAPDESAIITAHGTTSFAALDAAADAWARWLCQRTGRGDRVGIVAENRVEYLALIYGAARAGRIAAPLNHRLHPGEWRALLDRAGARIVVGEAPFLDALRAVLDRDLSANCFEFDAVSPDDTPLGPTDAGIGLDTDVALLIATSGTTGQPKWAMLTHRSLAAAIANLAASRPIADDDVLATPFPMCHVALYNVLAFHRFARPVALLRRFDPIELNDLITRARARTLSLAPTMIATWLGTPETAHADRASVRTLGYGASAIPTPLLRRAIAMLGIDLSQGYGMTELSGNAAFLDGDDHRRAAAGDERLARAAGRAGPLVEIQIADDDGRLLPAGTEGEIWVRGEQVFAGYWDDPAATAAALTTDGWLRTGDIGRLDPDGLLSIVDRKKDVIVTGGENVASREVERVLEEHPGVREVAVIGVADPTWGENVCAVVVPADPAHPPALADLVSHCRERLAGFKKPKVLRIVGELPKNATGKVQKELLRTLPEPDESL